MKNKAFSISLVFVLFIMLASVASAIEITKIGTGYNPAISGNKVTWADDAGSIHIYDLTAHQDTTINSSSSSSPSIYGNKIIWHDESSGTARLTVYDISSGARSYITQNVDSTSVPKIYGNIIVWGSNGNIYMRDISTSNQTQIAVGLNPDIYDTKIVYSAWGRDLRDIFMYDIITKKTEVVSPESSDIDCPHIYGNKVIWTNSRTRAGFIQMYDFVTKEARDVTSDNTGNTIIPDGSSYADAGDDTGYHTAIYGDKVVYAKGGDDQFGYEGVYVYNISTGQSTPIINCPGDVTPEIYNNTVVWGFCSAGDEIFVCNLTTLATTQQPIANFTGNFTSGYMPLSVAFTDTSTGTPTSWAWDFGDGNTSTVQNPMHVYSTEGHYFVNLTVSENNSTYSKYATITVFKPVPLAANFSTNVSIGYAPLTVQFTDLSENAKTWYWDFGDNTFDKTTAFLQNPVHTFYSAGNYTVNLTITNLYIGNIKSSSITVLEKPVFSPPVANFNANATSGYAPLSVQFTDSSQNATGWNWDFGDGTNSTVQSPVHIYSSEGTYNVRLTVNNAIGTDSNNITITVQRQSNSIGSSSSSSGGSSSSSGSGGAGGSSEPQSNVEAKELSQTFISSGQSAKFDFPQKATPVISISFDSKKTAGKTTTLIEMLRTKSTMVSGVPANEIYKFINIWVGNSGYVSSKNIENAVVSFKVTKSWVQDKQIDKSSITLNMYSDKIWNQLPTGLSGEDGNYLYFTAQTPGFSNFAITGKSTATGTLSPGADKTQSAVNITQDNTNTGSTATGAEQTPEQTQSLNKSGKDNAKTPGFELASGFICLLCIFLYKKMK